MDPEQLALVVPEVIHLDHEGQRDLIVLVDTLAAKSKRAQLWAFLDRGRPAVGVLQFEPEATVLLPKAPGQSVRLISGKEREASTLLGRVVWRSHIDLGAQPAA